MNLDEHEFTRIKFFATEDTDGTENHEFQTLINADLHRFTAADYASLWIMLPRNPRYTYLLFHDSMFQIFLAKSAVRR